MTTLSTAVRSPEQARATVFLIAVVLVVGQVGYVMAWWALTHPWDGVWNYLRGAATLSPLPLGSASLALPFFVVPRRWWGIASLVAPTLFAVASAMINLYYLHSANLSAQLMCVVGAFFAGYHFRRRAAYISLVIGIIGHAVLVWGLLPKGTAVGDMIFMDLFLTTMVVALVRVRDEQERAHLELHRQATTDGLTGLATRSVLRGELVACVAEGRPAALVLVDTDQFKLINDTFGHPAGDAALVEIANRMRTLADESHVLARLGGDEFAVLIRGASTAEAKVWAERLKGVVAQQPLLWTEPGRGSAGAVEIPLAVSVGAAGSDNESDAEHVYAAADRAMYEAKRARHQTLVPRQAEAAGTAGRPPHSRRTVRDA